MRVIRNADFVPVEDEHLLQDSLIVHARTSSISRGLVVFVHGLGGGRYATWGHFPQFVFEDCIDLDVGLYGYPSGLKRFRDRRSVPLAINARELADDLRDSEYRNIILVGHSMGGLLCKAVVKELLDSQTKTTYGSQAVEKISGLFLFATPQAGSSRVPNIAASLTKDGRVLRAYSAFATEIDERFKDRVECRVTSKGPRLDRIAIPTYAVLATGDAWVAILSASLGLPRDNTKMVSGTHSSIVKPESREGGAYGWFVDRLRDCMQGSSASRRSFKAVINSQGIGGYPTINSQWKTKLIEAFSAEVDHAMEEVGLNELDSNYELSFDISAAAIMNQSDEIISSNEISSANEADEAGS